MHVPFRHAVVLKAHDECVEDDEQHDNGIELGVHHHAKHCLPERISRFKLLNFGLDGAGRVRTYSTWTRSRGKTGIKNGKSR
jgi:hypothetical protein